MLRRTIVLALLPLVACPEFGRAQDAEFGRLASYVSRDAMLYVQLRDARAFVRRMEHTAIGKALGEVDAEDLGDSAVQMLEELAILVPEGSLRSFGAVLPYVDGEAVLAVEGMASIDGIAAPEVIAIVEKQERIDRLTKLAKLAASGDEEAIEELEDLELPFKIDSAAGAVGIAKYADAELFTLQTDQGRRIPIAVTPKLVLAASSDAVLKRAIDRGGQAAFGSLVDSLRFRESARSVETGPGSLLAYFNLRRVRHEGAMLIGRADWPRVLFGEWLEDCDGVCLSVRGSGDSVRARIELEQGRVTSSRSGVPSNESLRFPTALPATPFVVALPTTPRSLATVMHLGLYLSGNISAEKAIETFTQRIGGAPVLERILMSFGSEADVFLIGPPADSDNYPRLGLRIDLRDRDGLVRTLDALVANSEGRIRSSVFGSDPMYLAEISGVAFRSHCAWIVRKNDLLCFPNPSLAKVFAAAQQAERPLIEHEALLAACDRMDVDPRMPANSQLFLDLAALSEVLPQWVEPLWAKQRRVSAASRFLVELFHAMEDPDVVVGLSSIYARAEATPSGLRIDLIGP